MLKFQLISLEVDFKNYLQDLAAFSTRMRNKLQNGMCSYSNVVGLDTHLHILNQNALAVQNAVKSMNRESAKRNPIINADDIEGSIPMLRAHLNIITTL